MKPDSNKNYLIDADIILNKYETNTFMSKFYYCQNVAACFSPSQYPNGMVSGWSLNAVS